MQFRPQWSTEVPAGASGPAALVQARSDVGLYGNLVTSNSAKAQLPDDLN
jgi:hypothetical protein